MPVSVRSKGRAQDARGLRPPVFFDRNEGQTNPRVLYTAHDLGYTLFLTHAGATIVFASPSPGSHRARPTVRHFSLTFLGASAHAEVLGVDELPGKSNYFSGSDPRHWHTHVPQFAKVRYRNLYPGVDVVFYSRHGRLEYDLEAAPGANLAAIRMEVRGAKMSRIAQGGIALRSGSAEFNLESPRVYQEGKTPRLIHAAYSVHGNQLGFVLAGYDPARPVVIDPALIFATYLSSNCSTCTDAAADITVDASGEYIAGSTNANTFPATVGGTQPTNQNYDSTFVLKLDPTGTSILYASYLSSSLGVAVAVDSVGSVYVAGTASEPSGSTSAFPLTQGVFSDVVPSFPADSPISQVPYAAKLSPGGSSIVYSTLLQKATPNGGDTPTGAIVQPVKIAVDTQGALYVTGNVGSNVSTPWMALPVTQGAYQATPGNLFAMKLTPNASGLEYSTYFDGTAAMTDEVNGIAVDSSGDAFLAGTSGSGFPTTSGAYQTTNLPGSGFSSAFVFELNPTGTNPVYSTFFGSSSGNTYGLGIAIDSQDQAVLAGSGLNPPVTANAFCGDVAGYAPIGYVAEFNATGSALVYSTTLCGESDADAVAVDSSGNAYVTGATQDPASFQPYLTQPIQSYYVTLPGANPPSNMQVALKLDPSGNVLWSTFLGLSGIGMYGLPESRIALDSSGDVYLLDDSSADFPTTPGAIGLSSPSSQVEPGYFDFLLKIAPSLGEPVGRAMPTSVTFPAQNVGTSSSAIDVQAGNYGDANMTATVSISGDFSETNTCGTSIPPGGKCDVQVVFTPSSTGTRTGSLNFSFGGEFPTETISLTGSGTQPGVSLSPNSLAFGPQATGTTSGAQQVTLTNTGTGPLTVTSIQTTNEFAETNTCGGSIAVGGSCSVQVTFTPTATGTQTGTLTIADNAPGSPQTVSLEGNLPAAASLSPTSLSFGQQPTGTTSTAQQVTLTNTGTGSLTITSIQTTNEFAETNTCGGMVAGGGSCTILVTFTPAATGTQTGTLTIADNAPDSPQTVSLEGNLPAAVSLSPTSLSFGPQAIGTTSTAQQVTLTNTGTGPLTITSIQTTSEFPQTNTCGGTVLGGGSCSIQVTFTPAATGTQTGTLTITDNAPGSPQTVSLQGNQSSTASPTFSFSSGSSSTSATVTPGQTAAYTFSLVPAGGFTGSVSFSCTGAPSGTSCSVSPNPVNVTGTSPVTISVSVPTQAASTLFPLAPNPSGPRSIFEYLIATLALMTILLLCFPWTRRKFSWKTVPAALAILFLLVAAAACGGGGSTSTSGSSSPGQPSNPGTPAGTYTVTVTGSSGSISQSLPFTLNVK